MPDALDRANEHMDSIIERVGGSSTVHELKCWQEPFQAMWEGKKTHEIRKAELGRTYRVGDSLLLREWDREKEAYTGRMLYKKVTYITPTGNFGIPANLVVMSLA